MLTIRLPFFWEIKFFRELLNMLGGNKCLCSAFCYYKLKRTPKFKVTLFETEVDDA